MSHATLEGHNIYLVNPVHRDPFTQELTASGEALAQKDGAMLAEELEEMVVVSSTSPWHANTAAALGDISHAKIVNSPLLDHLVDGSTIISEDFDPSVTHRLQKDGVEFAGRLPDLLESVLDEAGVELSQNASVVMVAPSPVVAAAKGLPQLAVATGEVKAGEIVHYRPAGFREWIGSKARQAAEKARGVEPAVLTA